MKHKNFKCQFNPTQQLTHHTIDGKYPITYGRNITINAMVKALPKKEYDPKFIEWFVNFHAEMLCIEYWETFPRWMIPRLKKRAEEIHEGLHFNR